MKRKFLQLPGILMFITGLYACTNGNNTSSPKDSLNTNADTIRNAPMSTMSKMDSSVNTAGDSITIHK